tara:strand:+ start:1483 stop:1710 length:228 start_codon:yes stop_codon:yes gene_type:complete
MDNKTNCRDHPHHATITLKIDIRKINSDGGLDHMPMGDKLLRKYGMSGKAQLLVSGFDEADCINKIKERLGRLND